ncbi:MAG: hypothetical protein QXO40_00140 [Candidatus Aenigmatarchaeota archaeon]
MDVKKTILITEKDGINKKNLIIELLQSPAEQKFLQKKINDFMNKYPNLIQPTINGYRLVYEDANDEKIKEIGTEINEWVQYLEENKSLVEIWEVLIQFSENFSVLEKMINELNMHIAFIKEVLKKKKIIKE